MLWGTGKAVPSDLRRWLWVQGRLGGCLLLTLLMAVYCPAPWWEPSVHLLWGLAAVRSDTWAQDYMSAAILEIPGLLWILMFSPSWGGGASQAIFRTTTLRSLCVILLGTGCEPLVLPCSISTECCICLTLFENLRLSWILFQVI